MSIKYTILAGVITLTALTSFLSSSPPKVKYGLSLTLMPHYPQDPITFGIAKHKGTELLDNRIITRKNWILIGSGDFRNDANPLLENLFLKNQIPNCSTHYFPEFRKTTTDCNLIDRIWKVRYDKLPDAIKEAGVKDYNTKGVGWANNKMHPSENQMLILKKYGIKTVSDVIYGDSLWTFLKDINDANWIKTYVSD